MLNLFFCVLNMQQISNGIELTNPFIMEVEEELIWELEAGTAKGIEMKAGLGIDISCMVLLTLGGKGIRGSGNMSLKWRGRHRLCQHGQC